MGQRFQVVIMTPKVYWNKNNPNNKEGDIKIYHFQWLWGKFAVWRLGQFIEGVNQLIEFNKKNKIIKSYPLNYDKIIKDSLNWVCYKNLTSQNNYQDYGPICEKYNSFKDMFETFDNNNGILFVMIDKNDILSYCFWNPSKSESKPYTTCITYKEYLKSYESEETPNQEFNESCKIFEKSKFLKNLLKIGSIRNHMAIDN